MISTRSQTDIAARIRDVTEDRLSTTDKTQLALIEAELQLLNNFKATFGQIDLTDLQNKCNQLKRSLRYTERETEFDLHCLRWYVLKWFLRMR